MSKAEIIAELEWLSPGDLAEIQAKPDELTGGGWFDNGQLSEGDKRALEAELAEYERDPTAGESLDEAMAKISSRPSPMTPPRPLRIA